MSSQQKSKFFKDVKHYFWMNPICLKIMLIKSSEGVYLARKPLRSSRLAIMDPQETSGQVEVSNRGLKRILERAVGENRASSISLKDNIISGLSPCAVITPSLSTEEPDNSLSIGDEHLDTILEMKSNEFIKSCVESLILIPKISSGSTTTHFDSSLCDSFIFDLSINLFPPANRSDFYEFADELTYIISLPEYDCFCFKIEPNSGDFTMDVVEDTFPTREPRVHNALPIHPTFQLNQDFILSSESLFAKIPFLIPVSAVIISLLSRRMYLIGVGLSQNSKS
nr:reverse transcriptase domain-containing protein [Tanacetum cinerariifolium]